MNQDTPLHIATINGKVNAITCLKDLGVSLDPQDVKGRTPLHYAAQGISDEMVRCLGALGANLLIQDYKGNSPLYYAIVGKQTSMVKSFYQLGRTRNLHLFLMPCCRNGLTPLHVAEKTRARIEQPFDCIMKQGGNAVIEATSEDGQTPLHHAAIMASVEKIKALCEAGAKVDALDSYGRTPLHHLCSRRGWDAEELAECLRLLKIKDLNTKDCKGRTPAHYAAGSGLIAALHYLRSAGAKLDERDNRGRAPAYYAARNERFKVFKYLHDSNVDVKKDVNTEDEHKKTPLHHATEKNDIEVLRWLHQLGANMYAQDEEYYTCLHYAAKHRYSEAFDCLLSLGINIRAIIESEKVKDK